LERPKYLSTLGPGYVARRGTLRRHEAWNAPKKQGPTSQRRSSDPIIVVGSAISVAELYLRKRFYILFVARDAEGELRKIPIPLHYLYVFMA